MKPGLEGFKDWSTNQAFSAEIEVAEGEIRKKLAVTTTAEGRIKSKFSSFNGILWSHVQFEAADDFSCRYVGSGKTVSLFFHLNGDMQYRRMGQKLTVAPAHHNVCCAPVYRANLQLQPEQGNVSSLAIDLPINYYIDLLANYSAAQDRFIRQIERGEVSWLQERFMAMTMPMKWIMHSVRQNQRTGLLKRLFLEAKTLELLMLQIEQAEERLRPEDSKSRQQEALYEAKAILERNLDHPPTIKTLSRIVGINEFALKKGFKDTFQETIYGYVSKLKMQHARQLLLDGNKTVNEVSALTGYKNPQHFTSAFKKYFGILPSKLRS